MFNFFNEKQNIDSFTIIGENNENINEINHNTTNNLENEIINDCDSDSDDESNMIYTICINDIPYYYHEEKKTARNQMLQIARLINANKQQYHGSMIRINDEDSIDIYSSINILFLNYNYTLNTLKIEKVKKFDIPL